MVCPYCSTRNLPNAVVCTHCGVILKDGMAKQRRPKIKPKLPAAPRGLLSSFTYGSRRNKLASQIDRVLGDVQKQSEEQLNNGHSAAARVKIGIIELLRDEVEKSQHSFEQASQLGAMDDAAALNAMGIALARRGQTKFALERFARAIACDKRPIEPHINLAHALSQTGQPDNIEHAIEELRGVLATDPTNITALNRLGLALIDTGKPDEAIPYFSQVLSSNDSALKADAHNNLGIAHCYAGRIQEGRKEFMAALDIEPWHGHAMANLGILLLRDNKKEEAVEQLTLASHLDPESALVHTDLGYAFARDREMNVSIHEFREAILCSPHSPEPLYNLGKSYLDEDLPDHSERYLTRALQANPSLWQIHTT